MQDETASPSTYEFRWDVSVPGIAERRFGQKFMKQWKRVLQAQKMGPLVSAKLSPQHARFQLCVAEKVESSQISACEAEVRDALEHLRWPSGANAADAVTAVTPAPESPDHWQGVRVWMTFARQDVESVLGKKSKV